MQGRIEMQIRSKTEEAAYLIDSRFDGLRYQARHCVHRLEDSRAEYEFTFKQILLNMISHILSFQE